MFCNWYQKCSIHGIWIKCMGSSINDVHASGLSINDVVSINDSILELEILWYGRKRPYRKKVSLRMKKFWPGREKPSEDMFYPLSGQENCFNLATLGIKQPFSGAHFPSLRSGNSTLFGFFFSFLSEKIFSYCE